MSINLELLPALAALTTAIATAYSVHKLKSKVDAEKNFINELYESKSKLQESELESLINLRNKIVHNVEIKDVELAKVTELLELFTQRLKENDKKYIDEAMLQESIKGRIRYADKIISKIGIEPTQEYNKQRQADA